MKILFVMRNPAYVRNYESTILALAKRGHQIHICFNTPKDDDKLQLKLAQENANITCELNLVPRREDAWKTFAQVIRAMRDYCRYLSPRYENAHKLRARVAAQLKLSERISFFWPLILKILLSIPNQQGVKLLNSLLAFIENAIPTSDEITTFIKSQNPDLVLVTPLVDFDSIQTEYLKSTKALGIRCGLCVHSWDNLTNKGLIQFEPDRIFIWNQLQQQEAEEMHEIDSMKIVVTGAQCYDKWFERRPSVTQAEFYAKTGLKLEQPYVLYLCSSSFIAPQEVSFVEEWLERARKSDNPQFQQVGLLIRPHPQNAQQWEAVDFSQWGNVTIWPKGGQNPVNDEARANFFDSMYYSSAVLGVNTSAMIESGILGKPVCTILDSRFKDTQEGTLHFHHLVNGGLLLIGRSFDEHFQQLQSILSDDKAEYRDRVLTFIQSFVRPHGLQTACTPRLVDGIESMMQLQPVVFQSSSWEKVLIRVALYPIALIVRDLKHLEGRLKSLRAKLHKPQNV